jgi:hypothetical protein
MGFWGQAEDAPEIAGLTAPNPIEDAPSIKIFIAAFMSLSWVAPQAQAHVLSDKDRSWLILPQI